MESDELIEQGCGAPALELPSARVPAVQMFLQHSGARNPWCAALLDLVSSATFCSVSDFLLPREVYFGGSCQVGVSRYRTGDITVLCPLLQTGNRNYWKIPVDVFKCLKSPSATNIPEFRTKE